MKLHLPNRLRVAVMACMAATVSYGATMASASLIGGALVVTLSSSSTLMAEEVTADTTWTLQQNGDTSHKGEVSTVSGSGVTLTVTRTNSGTAPTDKNADFSIGDVTLDAATLRFQVLTGAQGDPVNTPSLARNIKMDGSVTLKNGATLLSSDSSFALQGALTVEGTNTMNLTAAKNYDFAELVGDSGAVLNITFPSNVYAQSYCTLRFNGTEATYQGTINLTNANQRFVNIIGQEETFAETSLNLGDNTRFLLGTSEAYLKNLSGTGSVILLSSAVTAEGNNYFDASISAPPSSSTLVITGGGTFSGEIGAGVTAQLARGCTLAMSAATVAGTVEVQEGASLSMTGSGTLSGSLVSYAGSALTLGGSLALESAEMTLGGDLTLAGLTLTGDGTLDVSSLTSLAAVTAGLSYTSTELEDGSRVSRYTMLSVADTVSLSGEDVFAGLLGDSWEWDDASGTLYYLETTPPLTWDANWGDETVEGAPVIHEMPKYSAVASSMTVGAIASVNSYFLGTQTGGLNGDGYTCIQIDSAPAGNSNANVFGGVMDGVSGSATAPKDSWIVYDAPTGGNYQWKLIVGGNGSNLSDATCSFYGDSHIMMVQGQVENIIGGNFRTNSDTLFSGSSYISVYDGEIRGFIVGAGTLGNGSNISTFVGNSNIFVYTILSDSSSAWLDPASNNLTEVNAAIVGGGAQGNGGGTIDFQGDTNITVDLTGVEPLDATDVFNKKLVGGSYGAGGSVTINHDGNTNITVRAESVHQFSKDIVGGSIVGINDTATHSGTINVSLNGGIYAGSVYLGGYMTGSNRSITNKGLSTLTVTGGQFQGAVLGGIYEGTGTSTVISSGIVLDLQGGTFTGPIIGGHYITGTGSSVVSSFSTGDITIKLGSGTEVSSLILGGSASLRQDRGLSAMNQGDITIEIEDGAKVYCDVYAAGGASTIAGVASSSTSKLVTESTRVAVSSGAVLGDFVLSGGYMSGTGDAAYDLAAVSQVTGSKTLALTSEGENLHEVLQNVTLRQFDTIEITSAKGSGMLTAGMIAAGITYKTGEGTLCLAGTETDTLTVSEGTVSAGGEVSTVKTLTMGAGTTLAFTSDDRLIVDMLDCTSGTVMLDVSGLEDVGIGAHWLLGTFNQINGWDNLVVTGLDPDFDAGLAWADAKLSISIKAASGVYIWDATASGGKWQNGAVFSADGTIYNDSDATKVRFDLISGTDVTETVTLLGDVAVGGTNGRLAINPGASNTYIFQADATAGGVLTRVPVIEVQSGKAIFEAGTLALSGSSMTSILIDAGAELELMDAGAGQFNLSVGDEDGGAVFTWHGSSSSTSTINGIVCAADGSLISLESGNLALAGSGNTLDDVSLSTDASLDLLGDTMLTGTLSGDNRNEVTLKGDAGTVLSLEGAARVTGVTLSGVSGSVFNVEGDNVTVASDARLEGMLLSVQKDAKLTFEDNGGETTSNQDEYWTGISSQGEIAGKKDLLVRVQAGDTYTCSGSLENFQGSITVEGKGTQILDAEVADTAAISVAACDTATLILGPNVTSLKQASVSDAANLNIVTSKGDGTNTVMNIERLNVTDSATLTLSTDLTQSMLVDGAKGSGAVQVSGSAMYGAGSKVVLDVTGIGAGLDLTGGNKVELIILESTAALGADQVSVDASGSKLLDKYFGDTAVFKADGNNLVITGTTVTSETANFYKSVASSGNGRVGAVMLDGLYSTLNPQAKEPDSDAAAILSEIEQMILSGSNSAADQKMAAVSGASVSALGTAFAADMQRQLTAIRNRTTTMGVGGTYATPDMPYFNAWVNAEANFREMNEDGTMPGYELNSWGATLGVDADVTPYLTCGLAFSAMYGDFTAKSADAADGDLDVYYVTAFARYAPSAWVHTFVVSVGMADASVDRTVSYSDGSYKASGDTNGVSFGLMYEVGYTIPMDESGTSALQPIANITYTHSGLDGYTESGSDMAVRYGDQTLDMLTIGVGLRAQAVVGENVYNRSSLLEGRVLAKFDLGDRSSSTEASLASLPAFGGTVESAESGAFGVEIGAGVTIPISQDSGSIFVDAALELRSDYTNINGTVGYRVNF